MIQVINGRLAKLTIVQGDATQPEGLGKKPIIIPHVCNDVNAWGAGFVLALSRAFGSKAEDAYHFWGDNGNWQKPKNMEGVMVVGGKFDLGSTQFVKIPKQKLVIANMIAQHAVRSALTDRPPIRYGALATCMAHVLGVAIDAKAEIHCPKFGSDLAGGNWEVIQQMILELWVDSGINVTVYEFVPR